MKQRCLYFGDKSFHRYGGRGITIDKRWLEFENFLKDMGERPKGMTLERKNNNKGYRKSNCKWATRKEQANNRRVTPRKATVTLTVGGVTKTIQEWAKEVGVNYQTIQTRRFHGWPAKECLYGR